MLTGTGPWAVSSAAFCSAPSRPNSNAGLLSASGIQAMVSGRGVGVGVEKGCRAWWSGGWQPTTVTVVMMIQITSLRVSIRVCPSLRSLEDATASAIHDDGSQYQHAHG